MLLQRQLKRQVSNFHIEDQHLKHLQILGESNMKARKITLCWVQHWVRFDIIYFTSQFPLLIPFIQSHRNQSFNQKSQTQWGFTLCLIELTTGDLSQTWRREFFRICVKLQDSRLLSQYIQFGVWYLSMNYPTFVICHRSFSSDRVIITGGRCREKERLWVVMLTVKDRRVGLFHLLPEDTCPDLVFCEV